MDGSPAMEVIVLVLLFALIGHNRLQTNICNGDELLRSGLFMSAIQNGLSENDANMIASFRPGECSPDMTKRVHDHLGSTNRMHLISTAYRTGMTSRLPTWKKILVGL